MGLTPCFLLFFRSQIGTVMDQSTAEVLDRLRQEKPDIYSGISISTVDYSDIEDNQLETLLSSSLETWKCMGIRGVWLKIHISHSAWIPVCAKLGFQFHHARGTESVMTKWMEEKTQSSFPLYPFTSVGVGGLVVSDDEKILLMKESRGPWKGWKFPGGLADPGEDLFQTACREVEEETGVPCTPVSVLTFRHMHKFKFPGCSDFYFVCLLKPKGGKTLAPTPCPHETADCRWFTKSEIDSLGADEFSMLSRWTLEKYASYKAWNFLGITPESVQSHGGKWNIYNADLSHRL